MQLLCVLVIKINYANYDIFAWKANPGNSTKQKNT